MSVQEGGLQGLPVRLTPKRTHFRIRLRAFETALEEAFTRKLQCLKGRVDLLHHRVFVAHLIAAYDFLDFGCCFSAIKACRMAVCCDYEKRKNVVKIRLCLFID